MLCKAVAPDGSLPANARVSELIWPSNYLVNLLLVFSKEPGFFTGGRSQ